ncbi:protein draper-like [Parasteatoda tepidariorum]|uniref:protein draper-like n=1 Tax=Parasteatoda tepidariorum TaxID=114398 RepID=UPI0039BCCB21
MRSVVIGVWPTLCVLYFVASVGALSGPNVCTKEQKHNKTLWITYSRPYQIRTTTWCLNIPPRCSVYRTMYGISNKQIVKEEIDVVKRCCFGYEEKNGECVCKLTNL